MVNSLDEPLAGVGAVVAVAALVIALLALTMPYQWGTDTSYSEFEADGTYHMVGDATVWDTSAIVSSGLAKGAVAPDNCYLKDDTFLVYCFDGTGSVNETAYGTSPITYNFKEGSVRYPHHTWCATTNDSGNVAWKLTTSIMNATHISAPVMETVISSAKGFEVPVSANFTAIGSPNTRAGDIVLFKISREPSNPLDTYDHDAALIDIGAWFEIDTIGSRTIGVK